MSSEPKPSDLENLVTKTVQEKLSWRERFQANKGAGYGAMVGAVAGAVVAGPLAPVGAAIGGAIGGGPGSLYDRKFRQTKEKTSE